MNEDFLFYLWKFQLFSCNLFTSDGLQVVVVSAGTRNADSGPDYFNAKVKIGDTLWAGNIEIHTISSDWFRHHHDEDDAYDNIILHVVYENDKPVKRKNGEEIPTIEIKDCYNPALFDRYRDFVTTMNPLPCHRHLREVNHFTLMSWFDTLIIERLEDKTSVILQNLSRISEDFNEVFYQKLCRNFGFKTNADAMEQLARSLPLGIVSKHRDNLPYYTVRPDSCPPNLKTPTQISFWLNISFLRQNTCSLPWIEKYGDLCGCVRPTFPPYALPSLPVY